MTRSIPRTLTPAATLAALSLLALPLLAQRRGNTTSPAGAPVNPPAPDRVDVPAGTFTMGSDTSGEPDERPAHVVSLPAFRIDRTEVTRENYVLCVRAGVCPPAGTFPRFNDPRQPIVNVTWFAAQSYCQWAGGRLPTETEWEMAARGTDGRIYPWGNEEPTPERAVYGLRMGVGHPAPVGSKPAGASPFGGLDMAGNVWEWTASVYDPYAYTRPATEPTCETALAAFADLRRRNFYSFTGSMGIPAQCQRTLRGGAWNYWRSGLRSSNRVHHEPNGHFMVSGIRCAADAASP